MLFDSANYYLFLFALFIIYYLLPNKFRWILLLLGSISFYIIGGLNTFWVPILIILNTYACGILIEKNANNKFKSSYFAIGLTVNLGLLFFYKYINFCIANTMNIFNYFNSILNAPNTYIQPLKLQFIVPLGISYVTFQAIGYLIEINRGNQYPEKNIAMFSTYILFFPKLFSGPIERAHNFLPQLKLQHEFNYTNVISGFKRILWGLFVKLVIANRLALYTDPMFNDQVNHSGITLLIASFLFMFQLFADFSAYTDIAIGSAQIFGYKLMENFKQPFLAKSVTEMWRKWHISLTNWLNEYVYTPTVITLRYWNKIAIVFALMFTFFIVGFWHGASWNYIILGLLQGFIISIEFFTKKIRKNIRNKIPVWLNNILGISFTLCYFCFSCIFFKSHGASDAFLIIKKILSFSGPIYNENPSILISSFIGVLLLMAVQIKKEYYDDKISFFDNHNMLIRYFSYSVIIVAILLFGIFETREFIYIQF